MQRIHIKMIDIIRADAFLWDFKQKRTAVSAVREEEKKALFCIFLRLFR